MGQWYYVAVDGRETGPVDETDLRQQASAGALTAESQVWQEGMADWAPAGSVPGLLPASGPAAIPDDPGPFLLLGKRFTVGKAKWVGRAVASPSAFYLLKASRSYQSEGGLVGILLKTALSGKDIVRTCAAAELPAPAMAAVAPKKRLGKREVIVLPRTALTMVGTGRLQSAIIPQCGDEKFPITCGMFGIKKAKAFLAETGWQLDTAMVPTSPPIHGPGYGLHPDAVAAAKPGLVKRVFFIALAILILLLVIVGEWARSQGH